MPYFYLTHMREEYELFREPFPRLYSHSLLQFCMFFPQITGVTCTWCDGNFEEVIQKKRNIFFWKKWIWRKIFLVRSLTRKFSHTFCPLGIHDMTWKKDYEFIFFTYLGQVATFHYRMRFTNYRTFLKSLSRFGLSTYNSWKRQSNLS